ncbi:MAG: hypothetical protein NVS3B21_15590 [Acidimicrobiales bacterium]
MRTFAEGTLVQLVAGEIGRADTEVANVAPAKVTVSSSAVTADVGSDRWCWPFDEVSGLYHGLLEPWTILVVPGVPHHGVAVQPDEAGVFRAMIDGYFDRTEHTAAEVPPLYVPSLIEPSGHRDPLRSSPRRAPAVRSQVEPDTAPVDDLETIVDLRPQSTSTGHESGSDLHLDAVEMAQVSNAGDAVGDPSRQMTSAENPEAPVGLEARAISAWFGTHQVLDRVSLEMRAGEVTALIGPSGCGKSTFLRILNRMHEMTLGAALAGEVLLGGSDIYDPARKLTDARRQIGMVFQKPNPFPAMSIYDNVVAGFQLTGVKVSGAEKDATVESCLRRAGLWNEVKDRLRQPGGSLSGGQQQRLCIARALAVRPKVLLMDEPCSALDPTSTRRIEETISELRDHLTIVIVTHNMQQAARVSGVCAFFLAEQGVPGLIVEHGPTEAMFGSPQDSRTADYVHGRFG